MKYISGIGGGDTKLLNRRGPVEQRQVAARIKRCSRSEADELDRIARLEIGDRALECAWLIQLQRSAVSGEVDPLRRGAGLGQFEPATRINRNLPIAGNGAPEIERPRIHRNRAVVCDSRLNQGRAVDDGVPVQCQSTARDGAAAKGCSIGQRQLIPEAEGHRTAAQGESSTKSRATSERERSSRLRKVAAIAQGIAKTYGPAVDQEIRNCRAGDELPKLAVSGTKAIVLVPDIVPELKSIARPVEFEGAGRD